jgi:hypothetical protein
MKAQLTIITLLVLASAASAADPILPNPKITPGSVRVDTIEGLLAVKTTKTIRNVPERERQQVFQRYGISYDLAHGYEVDHLLSLELGGDNSISNLWPQSYTTLPYNAHVKDKLENRMAANLRHIAATNKPLATVTLRAYQKWICTNWVSAYLTLVPKK